MEPEVRLRVRKIAVTSLVLMAATVLIVGWRAKLALRQATQEVLSESEIRFTVRPLPAAADNGFQSISSPAVFQQAAEFQGHLYVAGPAALWEYGEGGTLLHRYDVGRELPASPLVAIALAVLAHAGEPELVIATAQEGVLAFNGRSFRQIYPEDAEARAVTAILPLASGHLLIGTRKRGVLLYDGTKITALHATLTGFYVTALAGTESDLWAGTLDRGVFHWHAGETETFSEEQGLPDPQVQSLAVDGDKAFVGTVLGVAVFERGRFSRVLAPGVFASAVKLKEGTLYVGSEDEGVLTIPLEARHPGSTHGDLDASSFVAGLSEVRQFLDSGDALLALTRSGLYRKGAHGAGWQPVLQTGPAVLSDRNVSALAAAGDGRLWIGYFDRGLDVLDIERNHATHTEDDHVFCVNRILANPRTGTVDVATANGLVRFDASGSQKQVLTRADGLIADHVTDVALYRDSLAVATPAGLTFLDAGGARSMYAFHGLVNNHVYALSAVGDELLVGTLGGLSVIEKEAVRSNYTTTTSALAHNWITAVVRVGGEWMVGTYGAGILSLDSSGHFHPFENATGKFEVNPNAMLVTEHHVLAGTLGKGLYVQDRDSGRWSVVTGGLPSLNVTALAFSNGYLYVGTENGLVRISEQNLQP
jgi:ligand-binding sensor domain-containing protein